MKEGFFVHEKAICDSPNVGEGTRIWAFSHVMKGAVIGRNCNIGEHCYIENDVIIGDECVIKNQISIWDGVRLGDRVFLGPNVVLTNDPRPRAKVFLEEFVQTHILDGASIGANATIVCGVTIGKYAMVGAGAVVTCDVPDFALVYGNPARLQNFVCVCTEPLRFFQNEALCKCGRKFRLENKKAILLDE